MGGQASNLGVYVPLNCKTACYSKYIKFPPPQIRSFGRRNVSQLPDKAKDELCVTNSAIMFHFLSNSSLEISALVCFCMIIMERENPFYLWD